MKVAQATARDVLQTAETQTAQWKSKAEAAISNAKYDSIAREGAAIKLRVAQHELASAKADIARLQATV